MTVEREYRDIVEKAVIAAAGIGIPGALSFGLDVAALSTAWAIMIAAIADESGHDMDKAFAAKLAVGVLAGVGGYVAGSKTAVTLLNFIPGAGTLAAMGVNGVMNALYTYKMGHAMSTLLDKDGFQESDITEMATSLAAVVISKPSLAEVKDIVQMVREN